MGIGTPSSEEYDLHIDSSVLHCQLYLSVMGWLFICEKTNVLMLDDSCRNSTGFLESMSFNCLNIHWNRTNRAETNQGERNWKIVVSRYPINNYTVQGKWWGSATTFSSQSMRLKDFNRLLKAVGGITYLTKGLMWLLVCLSNFA